MGALGLVGVLVLASCSSGPSSTKSSSSTTSTSLAASPASTSSTPSSTSTSPTTVGSSTCQANSLALKALGNSGAAGTLESTFSFTNTSTTSCTLAGYAGAEMLDSTGAPLATQTTVRGGTYEFTNFPPTTVTLVPGATAYFNLGYTDVPTGSEGPCPESAQLEVTPPNDFSQLTVAFQATVCDHGTLVVSPVFGSGSPETQTTAPLSS